MKANCRYDNRIAIIDAARGLHGKVGSLLIVGGEKFGLIRFDENGQYTGSKANTAFLKASFLAGAAIDGVIAIEWSLISLGLVDLPVHPSFFSGSGQDFRYVLSIGALFMLGWGILLYWGSLRPVERRGILLLTAAMLFVAILSDGIVFGHLFSAKQLLLGTSMKLLLVILFAGSYWHSRRVHG